MNDVQQVKLSGSACWDAICSMAQKKEAKGSQGQMIPERERSVSFLPIICGTANISWSSLAAKVDSGSANGFPKGISEQGGIG